jgi:aerobic-type carbon monoxide dehydrogenase small subunit (CoxS/CutS family)
MTAPLQFELTLNGVRCEGEIDSRSLLVDAVRTLGATGARVGCRTGDCGACTIMVDGRLTKSCLVLAASATGSSVVTIEGSTDPVTVTLQQAFIDHKGFQCGFCTSGMILTAAQALREAPDLTDTDIRRAISGNLCRCTGYDDIVRAVRAAADRLLEQRGNAAAKT